MSDLLLNQNSFHLSEANLPCLIHGTEGSGSSFFTIELVRDMFRQGSKLLFFSAYPMAKEQFLQGMEDMTENIEKIFSSENIRQNKQALLVMKNDPLLFGKVITQISDIHERVILIKNIEQIHTSIITTSLGFEKIIVSGNVDACDSKQKILQKKFMTKIFFSPSESIPTKHPVLKKYEGYLENLQKEGVIKVV